MSHRARLLLAFLLLLWIADLALVALSRRVLWYDVLGSAALALGITTLAMRNDRDR